MHTDTRDTYTVWVCVDCYFTHHGVREDHHGTPDREPLSLLGDDVDVSAGLMWEEHECGRTDWDDGECECEEQTFSWSWCQGCGSQLGGSRHALTVWTRADS